jgi:hypothetical protein
MRYEELRFLCEEAAKDLVASRGRPVPATVVLPAADRTRLLTLPAFPTDDRQRHDYLAELAADQLLERGVPAWGFVVEGELDTRDVVVIAYGARKHAPEISAAPFGDDGALGAFLPGEELDPSALPFLHPLQHAVDSLPTVPAAGSPPDGGDVLPLFGEPDA